MVDFLSPAERSERMSKIRGKNTRPELTLRKALHGAGFRYRLNDRKLPGRPDVVLPRYKTVIFVHGCFWHRHNGCSIATTPKSNTTYWLDKFERNTHRDRANTRQLEERGWKVIVVWECELGSKSRIEQCIDRVTGLIRQNDP